MSQSSIFCICIVVKVLLDLNGNPVSSFSSSQRTDRMLTLSVLVQCPDKQSLQEVLSAAYSFLKSCSPKRRDGVRFYLLEPPVSPMQVLEDSSRAGFASHFRIVHENDLATWKEVGQEIQVLVRSGKVTGTWILDSVCRHGRALVLFEQRGQPLKPEHAAWCLEVYETRAEERVECLRQHFRQLFDDPSALSYMRRQALHYYNQYCNQVTRHNLLRAMVAQGGIQTVAQV
jgi:hypothetical protein